jgi:hypothetical protein
MIWRLIVILIGLFIIAVGVWWNKKYHNEKFIDNSFSSTSSLIGDIIAFIFFIYLFIMGMEDCSTILKFVEDVRTAIRHEAILALRGCKSPVAEESLINVIKEYTASFALTIGYWY